MQRSRGNLVNKPSPTTGQRPLRILYTGVVLPPAQQDRLLVRFSALIPPGWLRIGHHMTIAFASLPPHAEAILGRTRSLRVTTIGRSDRAIALGVTSSVPSANPVAHITLAIAPGAAAKDSNAITSWEPLPPSERFSVSGRVTAVTPRHQARPGDTPPPRAISLAQARRIPSKPS